MQVTYRCFDRPGRGQTPPGLWRRGCCAGTPPHGSQGEGCWARAALGLPPPRHGRRAPRLEEGVASVSLLNDPGWCSRLTAPASCPWVCYGAWESAACLSRSKKLEQHPGQAPSQAAGRLVDRNTDMEIGERVAMKFRHSKYVFLQVWWRGILPMASWRGKLRCIRRQKIPKRLVINVSLTEKGFSLGS